jgi:hypothetical protein
MNDNDIKQGVLLFKCAQENNSYIIYHDDINIGSLCRSKDTRWHLDIPSAGINLHGQYRIDLIELADSLYQKRIEIFAHTPTQI